MSSILGALEGGAIGIAVGEAGATVLEPALEGPKQEAWKVSQAKILELGQLAQLVATTLAVAGDVQDDVERNGYSVDQLDLAVQLALKAPGVPNALDLYRRLQGNYPGAITQTQLNHALGKAGLEGQWWAPLTAAATNTLLTPAEIALGIIRSTIADPGLLAVTLDTSGSNVKQYPVATLNALNEAAAAGIDEERLRVLVGAIGLPPSTGQLASAYFRNIITQGAYYQGILEGDARPEWADVWLAQAREILTAHTYVEGRLRGWVPDDATMYALTAQWGMSQADTDLLFETTGRPIPVHRVTQGLALQGSEYDDSASMAEVYTQSLQQSNIRPPWYPLAYLAERYSWPGYFVLKDLVPDPVSEAKCAAILTYQGWPPDLAQDTAAAFASGSTKPKAETAADLATQYEAGQLSAGDYTAALEALGYTSSSAAAKKAAVDAKPLVSARTSLLTKLRNGVVGGAITTDQATAQLAKTTVDPAIATQLVATWQQEYEVEQLTKPASSSSSA